MRVLQHVCSQRCEVSQIQASLSPKAPRKNSTKSLASQGTAGQQVHLYGTQTQDQFIPNQEIQGGRTRGWGWLQGHTFYLRC